MSPKAIKTLAEADDFDLTGEILTDEQRKAYDEHMPNPVKMKEDYATPGEKKPDGYTAKEADDTGVITPGDKYKVEDGETFEVKEVGKINIGGTINGEDVIYPVDEFMRMIDQSKFVKQASKRTAGPSRVKVNGRWFALTPDPDGSSTLLFTMDGREYTFDPEMKEYHSVDREIENEQAEDFVLASIEKKAFNIGDQVSFETGEGKVIDKGTALELAEKSDAADAQLQVFIDNDPTFDTNTPCVLVDSASGEGHQLVPEDMVQSATPAPTTTAVKKTAEFDVFEDIENGDRVFDKDDNEYSVKMFEEGLGSSDKDAIIFKLENPSLLPPRIEEHVPYPTDAVQRMFDSGLLKMASKKEASAPEGWESTVKKMKENKDIDNPWALSHWMKNKGYEPHAGEGELDAAYITSALECQKNMKEEEAASAPVVGHLFRKAEVKKKAALDAHVEEELEEEFGADTVGFLTGGFPLLEYFEPNDLSKIKKSLQSMKTEFEPLAGGDLEGVNDLLARIDKAMSGDLTAEKKQANAQPRIELNDKVYYVEEVQPAEPEVGIPMGFLVLSDPTDPDADLSADIPDTEDDVVTVYKDGQPLGKSTVIAMKKASLERHKAEMQSWGKIMPVGTSVSLEDPTTGEQIKAGKVTASTDDDFTVTYEDGTKETFDDLSPNIDSINKVTGKVKTSDDAHEKKEVDNLQKMQDELKGLDEAMQEMVDEDKKQIAGTTKKDDEIYVTDAGKNINVFDAVVNSGVTDWKDFLGYLLEVKKVDKSDLSDTDISELKRLVKKWRGWDGGDY